MFFLLFELLLENCVSALVYCLATASDTGFLALPVLFCNCLVEQLGELHVPSGANTDLLLQREGSYAVFLLQPLLKLIVAVD